MVTRTISPFELQPIRSLWDQYAPGNFLNNFPSLWDIGPGIVVLVGTVAWADWYFEVLGRHHRDTRLSPLSLTDTIYFCVVK